MSLLAGFDLVAELSAQTVGQLVLANVTFAGAHLFVPFEVLVPLSGADGHAHVIVNAADVTLAGDSNVVVTLSFGDSAVILDAPPATISPLRGTISVSARLALVPSGAGVVALSADMATAKVALAFDSASKAVISATLAGAGLSVAQFTTFAQSTIAAAVQAQPALSFGPALNVKPGSNGTFSPLVFEHLEVHNIGTHAVGLFGILLAANHANGHHAQKTKTAILPGHEIALSISPGAFRSLVFCPSVAGFLNISAEQLPTACGGAVGVDAFGATLVALTDTFTDGSVALAAAIERSGTCYDAHALFRGSLTFTIDGTTVTPHLTVAPPQVEVDIDIACSLAAAIFGGPIASVIVATASGMINATAKTLADGIANSIANGGFGLSGVPLDTFALAVFDTVRVTPEGLIVDGFAGVDVPRILADPGVALNGSVITLSTETVSSGMYVVPNGCLQGHYPYTESLQWQTGAYAAECTLFGEPRTYAWSLTYDDIFVSSPNHGTTTTVPLTATSGIVKIPDVECRYPMPLPSGMAFAQTVQVSYVNEGAQVLLTNDPANGNYTLSLEVVVSDPSGLSRTATATVAFVGDGVDFGGDWNAKSADCLSQELALIERAKNYRAGPVPYDPLGPDPPPEVMAQILSVLFSAQGVRSDLAIAHVGMRYGEAVQRMLVSPEVMSAFTRPAEATRPEAAAALSDPIR